MGSYKGTRALLVIELNKETDPKRREVLLDKLMRYDKDNPPARNRRNEKGIQGKRKPLEKTRWSVDDKQEAHIKRHEKPIEQKVDPLDAWLKPASPSEKLQDEIEPLPGVVGKTTIDHIAETITHEPPEPEPEIMY